MSLAQNVATIAEGEAGFDTTPFVLEAFDSLRISVTVFDRYARLIYANTQYNYLFRSLPLHETLIGMSYEALIRLELAGGEIGMPSLLDGEDAFVERRLAQFSSGDYRPFDIVLADGRVVEIKARRVKSGGWIATWTDVTDSRHVYQRLEDAIALSADAYAFFDARDRLVMCNTLYAHLHGAQSPGELRGWAFGDIAVRSARSGRFALEDVERWIERRLEMHQSPAGALTMTTTSGLSYLVRDRATRDGGRVVVFTDATDQHRAEAALEEQTQTLTITRRALARSKDEVAKREQYLADLNAKLGAVEAEADTAKTTLLRTMSHELKTPLNAIIGFSDLMQQMAHNLKAEQVAEYAGLIHQGGTNLLKMIMQILDLTKIAAGRYELQRAGIDAGGMLWMARDDFSARAEDKSITIDADQCPVGLLVQADENALRAMCGQLVENAVHFTPAGGCVTLGATQTGKHIALTVSDNGPGVDAEDLARILRPFEQSARNRSTEHSYGAGLGLTLVKELAELHGGTLAIASTPGEGFTAVITLPAA
ncbi:MAG TPA: PAS-domain containing protein [Rhizomicrobium sp.]|nr:PAS-domain containing protein [Rhizomicrobium sp.]